MVELLTSRSIECDDLGDKIKLEVSPYCFKVITGRKTYYFDKETGKFDGTSYQVAD